MTKVLQILLVISTSCVSSMSLYAQAIPPDSLYLGQTPPGDTPVIFAPGIVSLPDRKEPCITFAPDGMSAYFYIEFWPSAGTPYVLFSEYKNGAWTKPTTPSFAEGRMTGEPSFAFGGKRIYVNATKALYQVGIVDLSYVEKNDTGWSQPVSLGYPPNSSRDQYHACIVADTSIYFSSSSGTICRSQYRNGSYESRLTLPYPINYANTSQTWGDPFVSPDESYLIMKSTRSGGYGANDIYISYRKEDKSWTNPKNVGSKINTAGDETSGDITFNNKYMTFGRDGDIYWVATSFIDSLKHTNFVPYLHNQISPQSFFLGDTITYTIPDSIFIDDDGNNTLTYTAALSNGDSLPAWLMFHPATRTFSGPASEVVNLTVTVTVKDSANASTSCTFLLRVKSTTGVEKSKGQLPESINLYQNYPNPFNPSTTISYSISSGVDVTLSVFNTLGQKVAELVNGDKDAGYYNVTFDARGLASGVYLYRMRAGSFVQTRKLVILK